MLNAIQIEVLSVFIISTIILLTNKVRYDLVGIVSALSLILLGVISPTNAIITFASLPVFLLAVVMIISKAISDSGIMEKFGDFLTKKFNNGYLIITVLLLATGIMSGFMSDVALTLMMIPLAYSLADKLKKSPSKYLMPFAFIAVMGGRFTVASTSSNLILYSLWYQNYHTFLPYFTFTYPGFIILLLSVPLIIVISIMIPDKKKAEVEIENYKTGEYLTEAKIGPDSEVIGKTVAEFEKIYSVRIVGIYPGRIGRKDRVIESGDIIIVRLKPENVTAISAIKGVTIAPSEVIQESTSLNEIFVMPNSRLVGRSIIDLKYASRFNLAVLGISAYGKIISGRLRTILLEAGDVLLVSGNEKDIAEFIIENGLAPLRKRDIKIIKWKSGLFALGALILAVILSTAGVNILVSYGIALVIILATRSINFKDMYSRVEWPIVVFVGSYLVVGGAIISSGVSVSIDYWIAGSVVLLFIITFLLANLVGNVASAIIMGPIAFSFSNPLVALTVVAMAASCTFLTPFGNQSNLLVQSPGGYRTKDYMIYGSIMVALVFVVTMIYALA
ncbi:MAG: SLC13 family permease [Candidatus Thermoplasmatota archaeon]|jgi:di/tricarboxylate transporter|nr:SLC13 family permease [Candidatus Thermoplasmatota archaeon]